MANHDVSNPTFNPTLRKFQTDDPGHADAFNAVAEQLIKNDVQLEAQKVELFIGENLPEVADRKEKTLYLKVTDTISNTTTDNIQVSPTMGIKVV